MATFLIFRLYGPLASWGEVAVGEVRGSALRPTRSALLGLLGAALGLRRTDEADLAELARPLRFAVRVDSAGVPLSDYHTTQTRAPRRGQFATTRKAQLADSRAALGTILSTRDYRADALYAIAAWHEGEASRFDLERLSAALERPVFPLYLGRKSCPPALPLAPRLVEADTLPAAFERAELPPLEGFPFAWLGHLGRPLGLFWEGDPPLGAAAAEQSHVRRDDPASQRPRRFRNRTEFFSSPLLPERKDDGDVPEPDPSRA